MSKGTCVVIENGQRCGSGASVRNMCSRHYQRWLKYADPLGGGPRQMHGHTPEERFWAKVDKDGPVPAHRPDLGPCAQWTASCNRKGYGRFQAGSRRDTAAHKWAYEQEHGPVPMGLELDHLCRNRACVRVDHLEAVTHAENVRRGEWQECASAFWLAKTHCPAGHPYDEANTYREKSGKRKCRACMRARHRREYHAKRPARAA